MQRTSPDECQPGDWLPIMEAPEEWDLEDSPVSWQHPDGSAWRFAFGKVPVLIEETGEIAGTDFVWMRFNSGEPPPPSGPAAFRTQEAQDPSDRWKSE